MVRLRTKKAVIYAKKIKNHRDLYVGECDLSSDIVILKDGLPVFHRSYGNKVIENFELAAGFFQAILEFSRIQVGQSLEAISMSEFLFYFRIVKGFTFIVREERDAAKTKEQVGLLLNQLSERFFNDYPNADQWGGNLEFFEGFTTACDEILKSRPTRKGFPILFRIAFKPFFLTPVLQPAPSSEENEDLVNEILSYLYNLVEQDDLKKFLTLFKQPLLLYLSKSHRIVYVYPYYQNPRVKEFTHLLCFIADEGDWYTFYQLLTLIRKRFQRISPPLADFLLKMERDPASPEVKQGKSKILDLLSDAADLNQYITTMQASIIEEFSKSGITRDNLTEDQVRTHFSNLLTRVGADIDKIIFALLGLHQILFVGEDRQLVEQTLSAVLAFYPHPSVVLWAEAPSDFLLVGTRPAMVLNYESSPVIVDLGNNRVSGGEKNEFCSTLIQETVKFAESASIIESRAYFQRKIATLFTLLKSLFETLSLSEKAQPQQCQTILKNQSLATVQVLAHISESLNPFLAKIVQQYLSRSHLQTIW